MYKLNEEKMFFDVADGQAIAINYVTGIYYGSSSLGSWVLDKVVNGGKVEDILANIQSLPNCPENMKEELDNFISQLKEKEIIIESEESTDAGKDAISEEALSDGFVLNLEEFDEVQDLILADPVHDVDVEQGWPVFKEEE